MDEADIIKRLRRHDESALSEVIKEYTGLVSGVVHNLSGGRLSVADIEEICADTFITLWNNADKGVSLSKGFSWFSSTFIFPFFGGVLGRGCKY